MRQEQKWYYINDDSDVDREWQHAINYGQLTYELRKLYYGENNKLTLISYHNMGVYQLACCKLHAKREIQIDSFEKRICSAISIFDQAFRLRYLHLERRKVMDVRKDLDDLIKR